MVTKKKLIENELMKEIVSIRLDTLWKMLLQKKDGFFPEPHEEGATGKFDNKGAIFIPGGLIYKDVDEMPIAYDGSAMTARGFRRKVREAMRYDNATLLFPDGMATGVNLDSGFFSKAARHIFTFRKAAFIRKKKIKTHKNFSLLSEDITRSHCPAYMPQPFGARTRISTCASVGLISPPLFFTYCKTYFNLSTEEAERFAQRLDRALDPAKTKDGAVLYQPHLVVCHDTRYNRNSFTGLTRLLGIGNFGEFATFSFEQINNTLIRELKRKHQTYTPEDIFAEHDTIRIAGILRIYARTQMGKRSQKYAIHVVSPQKDMDLNTDHIKTEAQKRYHFHIE